MAGRHRASEGWRLLQTWEAVCGQRSGEGSPRKGFRRNGDLKVPLYRASKRIPSALHLIAEPRLLLRLEPTMEVLHTGVTSHPDGA